MIRSKKGASASAGESTRNSNRTRVMRLAVLGLFAALVLLMSFTPLGYLKAGIIEVSFLMIPVAAGAVLLGPSGGLILGALFGITSLIQAAFGLSAFGAALFSISPLCTILLCLVPRILMGWFSGLISAAFASSPKTSFNTVARSTATCLAAPLMNTVMFMGLLILFFWQSDYIQSLAGGLSVFPFIFAFVGINGLLEVAASLLVGTAVSIALINVSKRLTGSSTL